MSIEEIRSAFLGFYEKRLRLQLLRAELDTLAGSAQSAITKGHKKYSLITFDVSVIESIIADIYSITATRIDLLTSLSDLRQKVRVARSPDRLAGLWPGIVYDFATSPNSRINSPLDYLLRINSDTRAFCRKALLI